MKKKIRTSPAGTSFGIQFSNWAPITNYIAFFDSYSFFFIIILLIILVFNFLLVKLFNYCMFSM